MIYGFPHSLVIQHFRNKSWETSRTHYSQFQTWAVNMLNTSYVSCKARTLKMDLKQKLPAELAEYRWNTAK